MTENENKPAIEAEMGSIDELRKSIEQEKRFKTATFGYEKKSVQQYLDQLNESFRKALEEVTAERDRLAGENAELMERLRRQESDLAEIRSQERRRNETELNVRESAVTTLRAANQRLADENRRCQAENTELRSNLMQTRDNVTDSNQVMVELNRKLTELLQDKIRECEGIVAAWQGEFCETVDTLEAQVQAVI